MMRIHDTAKCAAILLVAEFACVRGWSAPLNFQTSTTGFHGSGISTFAIPREVRIQPFRGYDTSKTAGLLAGEIEDPVLFQGSVTVPIQVYLAAVVLAEIRVAVEIGDRGEMAAGTTRVVQHHAFHAHAQSALNQVLNRISSGVFTVTDGVVATVSGAAAGQDTKTFQATALPMRFDEVVRNHESVPKAAVRGVLPFALSAYFNLADPTFVLILQVVQERLSGLTLNPPIAPIARSADDRPVRLDVYALTTSGYSSEPDMTAELPSPWVAHNHEQPSPEYSSTVFGATFAERIDHLDTPATPLLHSLQTGQFGMSQRGLVALAGAGLSATQILAHYYAFAPPWVTGVEVSEIPPSVSASLAAKAANFPALRQIVFSSLSTVRNIKTVKDPASVRVHRRWRRLPAKPEAPESTSRYLETVIADSVNPNNGDIAVAVFLRGRVEGETGNAPQDLLVAEKVRFTFTWEGGLEYLAREPLDPVLDLGGTVYLFNRQDSTDESGSPYRLSTARGQYGIDMLANDIEHAGANVNKGTAVWFALLRKDRVLFMKLFPV